MLQTKVEQILKRYRVSEQILTNIEKKISYQKVYEGAGRGSQNRPFRRVRQTTLSLTYQRCQAKISEQQSIAGWRLYVTNAETTRLSLAQAVNSNPRAMAKVKEVFIVLISCLKNCIGS